MDVEVTPAPIVDDAEPVAPRGFRTLLLWILPVVIVGVAVWVYGSGGRFVSTDNAYVKQDRIDVAPQVSGEVVEVRAKENERVEPGQVVLVLDDSIQRVAVERAQAQLASAKADVEALKAAYREKAGELEVARRTAAYSVREFDRQRELADRQLVAAAQVDVAHRSSDLALGAIGVMQLQLGQTLARLGGDASAPVEKHPAVMTAAAELSRAQLDLTRTVIKAPRAGIVSHLPQAGDHVEAGRSSFAIVTDRDMWVEANFKETDLEYVRPGQRVRIDIDTYGHHAWEGRVESISQATGAEFSLLPPQNASGNWVKVVQRIPVRVAIEARPDDPPLRNGMSADVNIDTGSHTRFDAWFRRGG